MGLAACQRRPAPGAVAVPAGTDGGGAAPAPTAPPAVDPLTTARMEEVQHIVEDGAAPSRLAKVISEYAGEPASLVARKTALAALRTVPDRSTRLAALLDAARATRVTADADPLWPELVGALSETWAAENTAGGRKRMLREKDPRLRLLLVSSLAVYAASNRGLSDMTLPQRRELRGEFMRLYPALPPLPRRQIDAFVARIDVNARGTL